MPETNFVLSIICLIGGVLVFRGYAPHIRYRKPEPADLLATAIGIALVAYLWRTTYWDVVWMWQGHPPSNPPLNITLNSLVIASELLALKARLMMIPEKYRDQYNMLTCVFYPRRLHLNVENDPPDES